MTVAVRCLSSEPLRRFSPIIHRQLELRRAVLCSRRQDNNTQHSSGPRPDHAEAATFRLQHNHRQLHHQSARLDRYPIGIP